MVTFLCKLWLLRLCTRSNPAAPERLPITADLGARGVGILMRKRLVTTERLQTVGLIWDAGLEGIPLSC